MSQMRNNGSLLWDEEYLSTPKNALPTYHLSGIIYNIDHANLDGAYTNEETKNNPRPTGMDGL